MKILSILLLAFACSLRAQSTGNVPRGAGSSTPSTDPFRPTSPGEPAADDDFGTNAYVRHRMEEARKIDRKKRMVDNANRLLVLTKQLQADLQGSQLTREDEKRLDEIARLARMVKDQMRQ